MMNLVRRTAIVGLASLAVAGAAAAQPADPNKLFADSQVVVRDRFSVEVVGKGPDVVLIPGLSSSPRVWDTTMAAIPGYRYHVVRLAGFDGTAPAANGALKRPS